MYLKIEEVVISQGSWILIVSILNLGVRNCFTFSDAHRLCFLNNLSLTPKLVAAVARPKMRL